MITISVTIIRAICREILLFLYKICLGVQQSAPGCSYAFRETLILRYSPSKIFGENRKIASKNKVKIYVFNQDARKTKQIYPSLPIRQLHLLCQCQRGNIINSPTTTQLLQTKIDFCKSNSLFQDKCCLFPNKVYNEVQGSFVVAWARLAGHEAMRESGQFSHEQ